MTHHVRDRLLQHPYLYPVSALAVAYAIVQAILTLGFGNQAPESVESSLPTALVACWVAALGLGGATILITLFTDRPRWAACGLAALLGGLVIYTGANFVATNFMTGGAMLALSCGTYIQLRATVAKLQALHILRTTTPESG
jgi:hypothetical protein